MSSLKGVSTYFTGTTFSINTILLGDFKLESISAYSCKSNLPILAQQNL